MKTWDVAAIWAATFTANAVHPADVGQYGDPEALRDQAERLERLAYDQYTGEDEQQAHAVLGYFASYQAKALLPVALRLGDAKQRAALSKLPPPKRTYDERPRAARSMSPTLALWRLLGRGARGPPRTQNGQARTKVHAGPMSIVGWVEATCGIQTPSRSRIHPPD